MKIAIHQPNFFPWLPFFLKMQAADKFVILNHCQFEKNNYQNRFFYRDSWQTMSVHKGLDSIISKKYVNPIEDWSKIKKRLFDKSLLMNKFDHCITENLAITNSNLISAVASELKISTDILFDSETDLKSTDRLIWICKNLGADVYIAGSGGKNYMDLKKFEEANIEVIFQETSDQEKIHILDVLGGNS
jgi:hypothetical protein